MLQLLRPRAEQRQNLLPGRGFLVEVQGRIVDADLYVHVVRKVQLAGPDPALVGQSGDTFVRPAFLDAQCKPADVVIPPQAGMFGEAAAAVLDQRLARLVLTLGPVVSRFDRDILLARGSSDPPPRSIVRIDMLQFPLEHLGIPVAEETEVAFAIGLEGEVLRVGLLVDAVPPQVCVVAREAGSPAESRGRLPPAGAPERDDRPIGEERG